MICHSVEPSQVDHEVALHDPRKTLYIREGSTLKNIEIGNSGNSFLWAHLELLKIGPIMGYNFFLVFEKGPTLLYMSIFE